MHARSLFDADARSLGVHDAEPGPEGHSSDAGDA